MKVPLKNDVEELESLGLIDDLLHDMTTGRNILWTTDEYGFEPGTEIKADQVFRIQRRWEKSAEQKANRTKHKAEVFTPLHIVKQMVDQIDQEMNISDWDYVKSTRLEITCGEAPFLMTRYEPDTGEWIEPLERFGILDRKIERAYRISEQNNPRHKGSEWRQIILNLSYPSTYGYEYSGDSLFIARVNAMMTWIEHAGITDNIGFQKLCEIICWNFWQMDGLTCMIPTTDTPAKIRDWNQDEVIEFRKLSETNL